MDNIKIPTNPNLASALAEIEKKHLRLINATSGPLNRSLEAWKQYSHPFHTTQDVFNQMKFSAKDIYSSFEQFQNPLLSGDFGSAKIATIVNQSGIFDHLSAYTANWKENFNTLLKSDFRIAVVSQELEQFVADNPEEVTEKLLFKEIPEPSNKTESQFFQILYEFRQVPAHSHEVSGKTYDSQSENISNKEIKNSHKTPAFYKDKMWYAEVVLGIIIEQIYTATIGINPGNTIGFTILISCLIGFIGTKDRK
jgi:hypothetical protein